MTPATHGTVEDPSSARPLALVAEDNVTIRENTVRRLDRRGVSALAVGSLHQAANALAVSPRVDVALLDIHLASDKDADDRGGIAIARLLRSTSDTTRIIGYSGKFNEQSLSTAELDLFDNTHAKGHLTRADHTKLWELCADLAQDSYEKRRAYALEHQDQLRRLYEIEVPAVEVLRRLRLDNDSVEDYTAEGALGLAGYRVKVVSLKLSPSGTVSRPLLLWEQRVQEHKKSWVNLEVYGHPALYATGATEMEALESLATFVALTAADVAKMAKRSEADEELHQFLISLFSHDDV